MAEIEKGIENSRVLILCMTKSALESEWVRVERNTATFRDPANHDRRFLPLMFEDCTVPAMLRRVKYIDWRSESEAAWEQLQAHLQPGAEPLPEVPREEWNPYDPYAIALGSGFVGRKEELRRLQQAMENEHSVSVVGDWRIGKTSLLAAFAQRTRAAGRVVRELSGERAEGASLAAFVQAVTGRECPVKQPTGQGSKTATPVADPDVAADQLSEWATANFSDGSKPVLTVDESERLIETFDHRFFERVRGMLGRLMVVLCSRCALDKVRESNGKTSPFSNTPQLQRVALLESAAIEDALGWGNTILQAEDQSAIREWAGRHPYFVQLLAHELVDARLNGYSTATAHDRFYDTSSQRLRELWKVLADRDQEELRKAASDIPQKRKPLRLRGLVNEDGLPFARILSEWLRDETS